jgi:hypothetical protein
MSNVTKGIPSDGKIFGVTFYKKSDGKLRLIACRLGVKKGLTGQGLAYLPALKGLMCVFDMHKQAYRMINLKTVMAIRSKGRLFLDREFLNSLSPIRKGWF